MYFLFCPVTRHKQNNNPTEMSIMLFKCHLQKLFYSDIYVCVTDSLCCKADSNTTL